MKIHVVIAQRKCRYEGEYGPEILAAMTEYEYSDNTEPIDTEPIDTAIANGRESGEFSAVEMITLSVSEKAITDALFPARKSIPASVIPNP